MRRRDFILTAIAIPAIISTAKSDTVIPRTEQTSVLHWSDCATNSEPAYPAGPCDCFHVGARIEEIETGRMAVVDATGSYGFIYKTSHTTGGITSFEGFKNWRRI